jgi:serine/threonine-protein kinase
MFTALTGNPVHAAQTTNEVLLAAMTRRATSLGEVMAGAPKRLVGLVDRALAFDQSNRWKNARAMHAALRAVQAEVESQPTGAIGVVGYAARMPNGSLVPRAMWIARTRSWYILPTQGVADTVPTLRKRVPGRTRRGVLAGTAAFAIAFLGRTDHSPSTRADAPSASTGIETPQEARGVDPNTLAVAEAQDSVSEVPASNLAASANRKIRGPWQPPSKAEVGEPKVQNPPGEVTPPRRMDGARPEVDPLNRRK